LFGEIDVFVKKRVIHNLLCVRYAIINEIYEIMSDSRDRGKDRKKSMTKKSDQKFSALK